MPRTPTLQRRRWARTGPRRARAAAEQAVRRKTGGAAPWPPERRAARCCPESKSSAVPTTRSKAIRSQRAHRKVPASSVPQGLRVMRLRARAVLQGRRVAQRGPKAVRRSVQRAWPVAHHRKEELRRRLLPMPLRLVSPARGRAGVPVGGAGLWAPRRVQPASERAHPESREAAHSRVAGVRLLALPHRAPWNISSHTETGASSRLPRGTGGSLLSSFWSGPIRGLVSILVPTNRSLHLT